jgi:hypothetical protein
MRTLRNLALLVFTVLGAAHLLGFDARQGLERFAGRLAQTAGDARALVSGDYSRRVAERLRAETAQIPVVPPGAENDEYGRDLAEARRAALKARAEAVDQALSHVARGDAAAFHAQIERQAREAGLR